LLRCLNINGIDSGTTDIIRIVMREHEFSWGKPSRKTSHTNTMAKGLANRLLLSKVWHGKNKSRRAGRYGNHHLYDETGGA